MKKITIIILLFHILTYAFAKGPPKDGSIKTFWKNGNKVEGYKAPELPNDS